jgi:hypothetical protein
MHSLLRSSLWAAAAALFAMLGGVCVSVRGESLAHEATLLLAEWDRSAALDIGMAANRSREAEKKEVLAALVAGRLSLAEAAERLCQEEFACEGDLKWLGGVYPGLSEEEAACRHTVRRALLALPADPSQRARVTARLQAEFAAQFHHPFPPGD